MLTPLFFSNLPKHLHQSRMAFPLLILLLRRTLHTCVSYLSAKEVAMPILKRLRSYLDTNKIPYEV